MTETNARTATLRRQQCQLLHLAGVFLIQDYQETEFAAQITQARQFDNKLLQAHAASLFIESHSSRSTSGASSEAIRTPLRSRSRPAFNSKLRHVAASERKISR